MKYIFISLVLILTTQFSKAQYGNVWVFGDAGNSINFNGATPYVEAQRSIFGIEGCAVTCDSLGQLLFYTNGQKIWNSMDSVMVNGDSLSGNKSAGQVAIILPYPLHPKLFFVFMLDEEGGPKGLTYSIVDMNLSSGLGAVTQKNIAIESPVGEKIAATRHCNGQDWWIACRSQKSHDIYTYLLTSNGLNPVPVGIHNIYPYNFLPSNSNFKYGQLKFSPNGKYLADVSIFHGTTVLEFDNLSGLITNEVLADTVAEDPDFVFNGFGGTFSADSKTFHSTYYRQTIVAPTVPTIAGISHVDIPASLAAGALVRTFTPQPDSVSVTYWGIQITPKGEVWFRCDKLSPNNVEVGVIYQINKDVNSLSGYSFELLPININHSVQNGGGFPNFYDGIFTNHHKASLRMPTCMAGVYDSIPFFDSLLTTTRDYMWDFGDPASGINNTYNGQFPIHAFSAPGLYTVTLTLPSNCNPIAVTQQVTAFSTAAVVPIITFNNFYLESTLAMQYQWYFNNTLIAGAVAQSYLPLEDGDYTVMITDSSGCSQISQAYNIATVGLKGITNNSKFSVYPNPAQQNLYITNYEKKQALVIICDLVGKQVLQTTSNNYNETIDISALANGIYLIKINNGFNQKLLVNK